MYFVYHKQPVKRCHGFDTRLVGNESLAGGICLSHCHAMVDLFVGGMRQPGAYLAHTLLSCRQSGGDESGEKFAVNLIPIGC
jgi:hypothetical protein